MMVIFLYLVEPAAARADEAVHHEGMLTRKHEWETEEKKANNRYSKYSHTIIVHCRVFNQQ